MITEARTRQPRIGALLGAPPRDGLQASYRDDEQCATIATTRTNCVKDRRAGLFQTIPAQETVFAMRPFVRFKRQVSSMTSQPTHAIRHKAMGRQTYNF